MIYMDKPRAVVFRGRQTVSAHLMSDQAGPAGTEELDAFAASIGLRVQWRQRTGAATEHYDLLGGPACDRAEQAGARVVSSREIVRLCVLPKRAWRQDVEE